MCSTPGHGKNDHWRPPHKRPRQKSSVALRPNKVYWCSQAEDAVKKDLRWKRRFYWGKCSVLINMYLFGAIPGVNGSVVH